MHSTYAPRAHVTLMAGTRCAATQHTTLDSPALGLMTDFRVVRAVTIEPEVRLDAALAKMRSSSVRLLLVADMGRVLGLISAFDILGEKPLRYAQSTGTRREAITVSMIMTAQPDIEALDLRSVRDARIGHIIATLKQIERHHVLVVETDPVSGVQTIRGVFSLSQLAKQLGYSLGNPEEAAHSFAEIVREMT